LKNPTISQAITGVFIISEGEETVELDGEESLAQMVDSTSVYTQDTGESDR